MIYGICIWRLWKIPCEDNCDDKNEVEGLPGCQKVGPVPLPETLSAKYVVLPLLEGSFKKLAEILIFFIRYSMLRHVSTQVYKSKHKMLKK